jgi:intracellular septation protein
MTDENPAVPPIPGAPDRKSQVRSLLLGGLLPVIAFTVIEDQYGIVAGLVAGMVFGMGEILWEWRTRGKVDPMTWGGNGLILVMGGISLVTQDGIWFKLQPSIIEVAMALMLWGSVVLGRPFLVAAARKQGAPVDQNPLLFQALRGFTWRMGAFFALHAGLAAWAAIHWSTAAWAMLKGIGFTVSMVVYGVAESLVLRYRIAKSHRNH